jgi:tRNA (guanosine-2'-O-)-methyltransferase
MKLTDSKTFPELWEYLTGYVTPERKERFEAVVAQRTRFFTVVLEDIFQPHNASAVLRTCECFGIQDVHIIENENEYRLNPDVVLGSANWLTLKQWNSKKNNTSDCLRFLRKKGYNIVASSLSPDCTELPQFEPTEKTALIFGNEVNGISDTVRQQADSFVRIPMFGFTESFNISVAAAIILSSLTDKLHNSLINWHLTQAEKNQLLFEWICKHLKNSNLIIDRFVSGRMKE